MHGSFCYFAARYMSSGSIIYVEVQVYFRLAFCEGDNQGTARRYKELPIVSCRLDFRSS
jgi:hypothetical protein